MNICNRPVYQKGQKGRSKSNAPTAEDRRRWQKVLYLGCAATFGLATVPVNCNGRMTINHCGTGMGRKKDHKKVIGLCWYHHVGAEGIDGKKISAPEWEERFGSEDALMEITDRKLSLIESEIG